MGEIMMKILSTKKFCQLALVAVAVVAMANNDAMAWSYGSWGSSGSYGSYGSSSSYGSYGSGGSYGSHGGGLLARMRANRAARRASRSSYGSYGSYGSSGSYGSCGSCGGYACCGSSGGVIYYSAPQEVPTEAPTPDPSAPSASSASDSASIAVTLPANAKVFVNNQETTSTGSLRNYVSKGLEAGKTYAYKLRVEFELNGEKVVEHKVLKLRAGDSLDVNFGSEDSSQLATEEPVDTELKVVVPAGAQVFLSGTATKQQGTLRSFITKRLASGQAWDDYTVRVELEQDGQKLVKERTLTVVGGQTYELAFDFGAQDEIKVAQLAK